MIDGRDRHIIIGAGGTGSHLIAPLVAYLTTQYAKLSDWELIVVDGDHVEKKNYERQLFPFGATLRNKAEALILPYREMYSNIHAIQDYLNKDNIDGIIEDGSIVYICVDNYPVRSLIENHCMTLNKVVVINGGNEKDTGSCQIWLRDNGSNLTPKLSFLHPEIHAPGEDRAEMTCQQIAELPGGEQLIVTNMASAMFMLSALINLRANTGIPWTELQFDLNANKVAIGMDNRNLVGWN